MNKAPPNSWQALIARRGGEVVRIEDDWPDALVAMVFLAVLAYPRDTHARDALIKASRSFLLRDYIDRGGDPENVRKRFRDYPPRDLYEHGQIHMAWHRIGTRRLRAADIAADLLFVSVPGWTVRRHGVEVTDRPAAIKAMARRIKWKRPHVHTRIWKESEPVLHICMALRSAIMSMDGKISAHQLLRNPEWARPTIKASENIVRVLTHVPALGISAAKAIRFQIAA